MELKIGKNANESAKKQIMELNIVENMNSSE
jgi:hypothetical protein